MNGSSPGEVIIWALLGLLVGVPVLLLLKGAIDGAIDTGVALSCCGAIFILLALTIATAGTMWTIAFVFLLLLACAGFPFYFSRLDNKALQEMHDEDRAKYIAVLERDPRNASAHAMLAENYLQRGEASAAVQHYTAAVAIGGGRPNPQRDSIHNLDTNPNLEKWKRRLRAAQEALQEQEAAQAAKSRAR